MLGEKRVHLFFPVVEGGNFEGRREKKKVGLREPSLLCFCPIQKKKKHTLEEERFIFCSRIELGDCFFRGKYRWRFDILSLNKDLLFFVFVSFL